MYKLYRAGKTAELPSVEGIVEGALVEYLGFGGLNLTLEDSDKTYTVLGAAYRINRGEHVVLYSLQGFDEPLPSGKYGVVGLQVLGEDGEVDFQASHHPGLEFRKQ